MSEEKQVTISNEEIDEEAIDLKAESKAVDEKESSPNIDFEMELEKLREELKIKDDRILRLQADFDNFRKRTIKEKMELAAVIEQEFLKDLLSLVDNLIRASKAADNAEEDSIDNLRKGIEMIKQDTISVMCKHGLETIETQDKIFDPKFHQAVGTVKDDTKENGIIVAEFQRGYMARGKVIRPSMVQIVSNS